MQTLKTFKWGTIVCDGCAHRIDSGIDIDSTGVIIDTDELVEITLPSRGWKQVKETDPTKWLCPSCQENDQHRKFPNEGRVIEENIPLYGVMCDRCGAEWVDVYDTGASHFTNPDHAEEEALNDGWADISGKIYCPHCWYENEDVSDEEYERTEGRYVQTGDPELEEKGQKLLEEQKVKNAQVRKECNLEPQED